MTIFFIACTQEDDFGNKQGMVQLKSNLEDFVTSSRVGFTDGDAAFFWTTGDQIGVTSTSSTSFQPMTLSGKGGDAQGIFTATMSGTPSGYAVYPYGEEGRHSLSGDELTYTLPTEYTYAKLDATYADPNGNSHNAPMWAKISNGTASFKHLGGVFAININGLPEKSEGLKLTLMASSKISGEFTTTLTDSEPQITTEDSDNEAEKELSINFNTTEGQTTGYFYIPMPTGEYENIIVTIVDSEDNVIANKKWDNFTVNRKNIKRTNIQIELDAFKVGEYYEKGETKGVIFWVSDDGKNAKLVALKRSETTINFAENDDQYKKLSLGLTSADDGEVNTNIMKNCSIKDHLPILAYVPEGWYIPAKDEMVDIFKAYNGSPGSATLPADISPTEKAARAAWDKILTDNGGDVMNAQAETATGDSYYTSTEYSASNVYYVRFGQYLLNNGAKAAKTPSRYVRCIRKISK